MIIHRFDPQLSNSPTVAGAASAAASASETAPAAPASNRRLQPPVLPHEPPPKSPAAAIENDRIEPPHVAGAWSAASASASTSAISFGEGGDKQEEEEHPDEQAKQIRRPLQSAVERGAAIGVAAVFNARDVDVPFLGQRVEQGSDASGHRLGISGPAEARASSCE